MNVGALAGIGCTALTQAITDYMDRKGTPGMQHEIKILCAAAAIAAAGASRCKTPQHFITYATIMIWANSYFSAQRYSKNDKSKALQYFLFMSISATSTLGMARIFQLTTPNKIIALFLGVYTGSKLLPLILSQSESAN